jgi:hypothetical protein
MAEAMTPPRVKLFCGMIAARRELFDEAAELLTGAFGSADLVSDVMDFDFTHYYDRAMGSPLYRRFISFRDLVSPDALIEVKLATNAMERHFAERVSPDEPPRPINLDPGIIDTSKLVLASMKDFSHRIYLGRSVFAEVTLMFHKNGWESLPWTFPDYASPRYHSFLTAVRRRLGEQRAAEDPHA